ncbi:MAG: hypothetical protein ABEJ56_06910 [Candidatus Nanohaloarchaea archaeon]
MDKKEKLQEVFNRIVNDLVMITGQPVRLVWNESIETAATDCVAEVEINPRFFVEGLEEIGYGVSYHEGGHICYSPYAAELMQRARKKGGNTLATLVNIIADRKDDMLNASDNPGIAKTLRERLLYICTLTRRKEYKDRIESHIESRRQKLQKRNNGLSDAEIERKLEDQIESILKSIKPKDVHEDFFCAAKWHKQPHFRKTYKAMKYVRRERLLDADKEELLWIAEQVYDILGPREQREDDMMSKMMRLEQSISTDGEKIEIPFSIEGVGSGGGNGDKDGENTGSSEDGESEGQGEPEGSNDGQGSESGTTQGGDSGASVDKEADAGKKTPGEDDLSQILRQIARNKVKKSCQNSIKQMINKVRNDMRPTPGPFSGGGVESLDVEEVDKSPGNSEAYQRILNSVKDQIDPLTNQLEKLDSPSKYTLHGQDDGGSLDFSNIANIACGIGGQYKETVTERDVDAELHLALDNSGSMGGGKLLNAKRVGVLFSEAVMSLGSDCEGRVWSYNSEKICDFGEVSQDSGFVRIGSDGGTPTSEMLKVVGEEIVKSDRQQKVLVVVGDDGPHDKQKAKKLSRQLLDRGVLVVHILVGVHGAPQIYPVQLLFSSMEECVKGFGDILEAIVENLK